MIGQIQIVLTGEYSAEMYPPIPVEEYALESVGDDGFPDVCREIFGRIVVSQDGEVFCGATLGIGNQVAEKGKPEESSVAGDSEVTETHRNTRTLTISCLANCGLRACGGISDVAKSLGDAISTAVDAVRKSEAVRDNAERELAKRKATIDLEADSSKRLLVQTVNERTRAQELDILEEARATLGFTASDAASD